jgi:23S rRNA (cytidine1920-2'-O)/16S rRNA (cytidine1409-2'-O)-methyltransferase
MNKKRLDQAMVARALVPSRSQAESFIKLGEVKVNGRVVTKAGSLVSQTDEVSLTATEQYVSRAGLKLASVAKALNLDFKDKVVLDVGSSTGGFTDYTLQHGARKVLAVELGTDQLHPKLQGDPRIELHEKTDIRDVWLRQTETRDKRQESNGHPVYINDIPQIVVLDVSFISLREILPHVSLLMTHDSIAVAMVKPQFEAVQSQLKHKGVIKNDRMRRDILKDFEDWARQHFVIVDKADSDVTGMKGNRERFYLLKTQK